MMKTKPTNMLNFSTRFDNKRQPVRLVNPINSEEWFCDDYTDNKFIDGVEYIRVHKQDNRSFLMRKDTLKKINK